MTEMKKAILFSIVFLSLFSFVVFEPSIANAVVFTRSVFLQNVTTNSIEFRWVTDTNEQLIVKYGTTTSYGSQVNSDTVPGTGGNNNHAKISGLTPNTKYFYQVTNASGAALTPAGDANHYFKTSPSLGSSTPISFAFWGDSGDNSSSQDSVAKGVFAKKPDLAFIAGDIAYNYTTDFNANNTNYFNHYSDKTAGQNSMSFSPYYVTCGNHESSCPTVMADHSLPGNGNMGGTISTYSFDYGNVHFVSLNSNGSYSYPSDAQMSWALNDLRNSNQPWKIIYWHHNGWSHGSHSTDTTRQTQIGNLAKDGGAQMVFWGHSHSYERWNKTSGGSYTNPFPTTQFFTIGNGGKTNSTSCTPAGSSSDPGCAAKDSGPGYLLAQVNGNQMTVSYFKGTTTTAFDSVVLTSSGSGPTNPPVTNPPATPTRPPNATATRTPTGGPTGTCPGGGVPGDSNGDGKVDGIDFTAWLNHYNQSFRCANNGDYNNSGFVDGVDFTIWLNNYNAGGGTNPTIEILSPLNGSVVSPNFQVQFRVTNWNIGQ
jgi:hypothetical protein